MQNTMFEAGFTYILSKSLMNTRTKNPVRLYEWDFYFFIRIILINSVFGDNIDIYAKRGHIYERLIFKRYRRADFL